VILVRSFVSLVVVGLLGLPGVAIADPTPFATVTDTCAGGDPDYGTHYFSGDTQSAAHTDVLERITSSGSGALDGNSFGGGDVIWQGADSVGAGRSPGGLVECSQSIDFTASFFDVPLTPTSFAGAMTAGSGRSSTVSFATPASADYVADFTIRQGALNVETPQKTLASSGTVDLGTLGPGVHALTVGAKDGPQVIWSVTIHARPVVVSAVFFDRKFLHPGAVTDASYTLSGDAKITAAVAGSGGQVVRQLATNLSTPAGVHTLSWDGLDSSGKPVADDTYTVRLSGLDATGATTTGQSEIVVDTHGPVVTFASPPAITANRAVVVRVADTSGVRSATLLIGGRPAASLHPGTDSIIFRPVYGWRTGVVDMQVVAVDAAGNRTVRSKAVHIR
jgi:FlgD Ig-like domain